MSGVVDVGDAVELTFTTNPGATVVASWLDPQQAAVIDMQPVTETPTGSGNFPYTFLPTRPGLWTAWFVASGLAIENERYYIRAVSASGALPLAAVGDVASQYGTLTVAQESLTSYLLRAASKLVRSQYPLIDSQITAGVLDADVVALGVANMVLRVLRNPGGLRAETVGPFSRTYDTGTAAGLLVISDNEASMFTPITEDASKSTAIGSVRMNAGLAPRGRYGHAQW